MTELILFRTATLIDKAYKTFATVNVPRTRPWPEAIQYAGRTFKIYPMTRAVTIEAAQESELAETYREIEVYVV